MNARRVILGLALSCLTFAATAADNAPSIQGPWLGEWQLNIEKSNFASGKPPAGTVRKYAMTATGPDTFDVVIDFFSPQGAPTMHMETRGARFDGKDYKETGNPMADINRFHVIDERTYEFGEYKNGVEVMRIRADVSADGKTRTSRQKRTDADGKTIENVAVWDRVK